MSDQPIENKTANAWIAIDDDTLCSEFPYPEYALELNGEGKLFASIAEGDWVLLASAAGQITRVGRVLRLRSNLERTTIYFDRLVPVVSGSAIDRAGLALPGSGSIGRLQWSEFEAAVPKLIGKGLDEVPLIQTEAYIRELLQLAVMDDLLGPANGPEEQIVDMSVRDRYLVAKLAPRPAMLIRVYTAFLTAGQALFDRFGQAADPYLTTVGYFNSLRELGGMKRLAEDDVQTRSYRVQMSLVDRPGLAQRSVSNIRELTSRVSSRDIPKYLDQMEIKFKATFDEETKKYVTQWEDGEDWAIDVVLATNMLSVGVDVNRLGLMVVNGQPKGTAEYFQATSRVGRNYERKGPKKDTMVALLRKPGIQAWDNFTVPMSMREVEPGVSLIMNTARFGSSGPAWAPPSVSDEDQGGES